jgi:hypothetical protein
MPAIQNRLTTARLRLERERRIRILHHQVKANTRRATELHPVVMFAASTRLSGFSQNAAFALLTAWGLQLEGVSVIHFACRAGMSRCVLGTNPDNPQQVPPCKACVAQSQKLYASAITQWFEYQPDAELAGAIKGLSLDELGDFEIRISNFDFRIPLGSLVLPSLRWALRRHHLIDDEATRFLLREYIQSAYRVAVEFAALLREADPRAVVLFNGLQFPEAAARWVARQFRIPVITHEVGFQPFSVFFSRREVTAYPIDIPEDFELSPEQQARIEAHLSRRFQGEFTMAGITFWPEMSALSQDFLQHATHFERIVPIFTNVIFDTSQIHANTIFSQMFAWLDLVLEIIRAHPETLFVIRAHPDEMRPGKQSRESVQEWVAANHVGQLPNVIFVGSDENLSSYDLIRRSKFVMVYNSSIGLEATLLGAAVLCGGKARYTQYPTVFLPPTPQAYREMAEEFLAAESITIPAEFERNAWRVLYHQFYRASLPLDRYLEAHPTPGYVQLKAFAWRDLLPENSLTMRVILDGILNGEPFLMPEESGQPSAISGQ